MPLRQPLPYQKPGKEEVYQAFEILDAALEYDYLEVEGHDSEVIIGTLKAGSKKFNGEVIEAITQLQQKSKTRRGQRVALGRFKGGHAFGRRLEFGHRHVGRPEGHGHHQALPASSAQLRFLLRSFAVSEIDQGIRSRTGEWKGEE